MLFDLRGRGRRRAVQAIYLSLAVLMGGGLVLFGVGGATSGGLLDAFKSNSGSQSVSDTFKKRVASAESGVRVRPTDPKAWAELTRVRFQQAGTGDNFDQVQGVFTDKGKDALRTVETTWDKYQTLTKKPDPGIAALMVQAFGQYGLNEPAKAVDAQEDVIDSTADATGQQYVQLAALAYQAGQTRKAELSSKKALSLTPKDDQEQIKAALQDARQSAAATASTATPSNTTTPSQ
jgi:hypothetical protein